MSDMRPQTIEELKQYCMDRGMPLERMRFFIGEDCREPRAFGIYRDGDRFVVYKNKANGSRAVRYHGPDEAYAVNELYQKLLDEHYQRGMDPNAKPSVSNSTRRRLVAEEKRRKQRIWLILGILMLLIYGYLVLEPVLTHRHDGYYRSGDDMYYRYGDGWYYFDDIWRVADYFPYTDYDDYYVDDAYQYDMDVSDFKDSDLYKSIRESESSSSDSSSDWDSSDYDSWDSGDTDWDSDW